jgi:hypothetical protein
MTRRKDKFLLLNLIAEGAIIAFYCSTSIDFTGFSKKSYNATRTSGQRPQEDRALYAGRDFLFGIHAPKGHLFCQTITC